MASMVKDAPLVGAHKREGDVDVAERVEHAVSRHYDLVWRTLRRCGVGESASEDAAQEVFCVFARRLSVVPREKERAFLCGVAAKIAVAERRRAFRHDAPGALPVEEAAANVASHDPSVEELLDDRRAREMLDALLSRLPDELRIVFVLHELEEMTMADIAAALAIPPGTAASRLRRARASFENVVREVPPPVNKKKIVGAVLAAAGLTSRRATAASGRIIARVLSVAALMGTALYASSHARTDRSTSVAVAPAETPTTSASPSLPLAPPAVQAVTSPPPSTPAETPPRHTPRVVAKRASSVAPELAPPITPPRSELALVRDAKKALVDLDATKALAALGERDRVFPRGAFDEEADALRVEAFALLGDVAMTRRAASNFFALHSKSAYEARVRRALGAVTAR